MLWLRQLTYTRGPQGAPQEESKHFESKVSTIPVVTGSRYPNVLALMKMTQDVTANMFQDLQICPSIRSLEVCWQDS